MEYLFIAEKPSLMREVLACYKRHMPEIINKVGKIDFIALAGHVCRNCEPTAYEYWSGNWDAIQYPMVPQQWKIEPIKGKEEMIIRVRKAAAAHEGIIVGTDSDTEGYGIYYLLETYLGLQKKKTLRFMEHSLTDKEILESLLTMTDYHTDPVHIRFVQSYLLRSRADWLYGMNATREATVNTGRLMTIGRVKAPTIRLVYDNSLAIENFKPETYYLVHAAYQGFQGVLVGEDGKAFRFQSKEQCPEISRNGVVASVKSEAFETYAPKLYDLPSLQMDAGQMLGLTPKETLEALQSLYEKHKAVSYPRTQCRYVSTERTKEFPVLLRSVSVFPELADALPEADLKRARNTRVVNDSEVSKESHDALLPTSKLPDLSQMTEREKQVLRLVYTKFLAQFLPPLVEKKTVYGIRHGDFLFRVDGKTVESLGWRRLYGAPKDSVLPDLKKGDAVKAQEIKADQYKTKPPKRLTQATLIKAMENIAEKVEDPELRKSLAGSKGIGTPATRDSIIVDIIKRGYVQDKKGLYITQEGKAYIEQLAETAIISPVFAAQLDYEIKKIQRGEAGYKEAYARILNGLDVLSSQLEKLEAPKVSWKCPNCRKRLINGRYSYTCPECSFSIPKKLMNVTMTDTILQGIYSGKPQGPYTFRKKDGSTFRSRLVLTRGGVGFDFSTGLRCPFCGSDMRLNKGGAFCDCGLNVYRNVAGKELNDTQIRTLAARRLLPNVQGFRKKDGTLFSASLRIADDKTVQFIFND